MWALYQRQEVLELQQSVRNMLKVVRSVSAQTVDAVTEIDALTDHFEGHLDALARTQLIGTRSDEGPVNVKDLSRDQLMSVGAKLRLEAPMSCFHQDCLSRLVSLPRADRERDQVRNAQGLGRYS